MKRHYFILLAGLVFAAISIGYDFFLRRSPQTSLDQSMSWLYERYESDSVSVSKVILSKFFDTQKVEDSPFQIEVYMNDSLVYWNKQSAQSILPKVSHWVRIFESHSHEVRMALSLFDGNKLAIKDIIPADRWPQYEYIYNANGKVTLPFSSQSIKLNTKSNYLLTRWHSLLYVLWVIAAFLLHLYLMLAFWKSEWNRHLGVYILANAVVVVLMSLTATHYLFGSHSLITAAIQGSEINLTSYLLILQGLAFLLISTKHRRKWDIVERQPILVKYLIGGIIGGTILSSALYISENLILDGQVQINIEEVLNQNSTAIIYLILMVFVCLLYTLTCAVFLKEQSVTSGQILKRVVGHGIGFTMAISIFYLMGLTTPIIPFVAFVFAYFLLHDLYSELNAKNFTYVLLNIILFSFFIGTSVFYYALRKDKVERKDQLHSTYAQLTAEDQAIAESIRDTLLESGLIYSIAEMSYPAQLDHDEMTAFLSQKILSADSLEKFKLEELDMYDRNGNSLFSNHISLFQKNSNLINNSIKVSNHLFHYPIANILSIYFEVENEKFPTSPINVIIKLAPTIVESKTIETGENILVYKNNTLIESATNAYINKDVIDPASITSDLDIGEMSYVVYQPSKDYKLISYHKVAGLIKPISFFSMLFVLFGMILLVVTGLNTKYSFLLREFNLRLMYQTSLRSKIQLSVIILILVSFAIIGIITTLYFKNSAQNSDATQFKSELKTIINDVQNKISETIDAESANSAIANDFSEIENIYNKKFVLYNADGIQVKKSTGYPKPYAQIPFPLFSQIIKDASEGHTKSVSQQMTDDQVLVPLYQSSAMPVGYIATPIVNVSAISNSIYNHLGNLLNVYIFLFFLAGAISIWIANNVTQPLSMLREGVKRFKLGGKNEPLKYDSTDELGVLIKEYNNMTKELEKSAQIIAKTERDMAWREMAKQVAHEIKNPLTPMKLHIQYLENTLKTNPANAVQMIGKVSGTIIEQIDNLSNIASAFSNYATLPKADNNKTMLKEVLEHVHDLFRDKDDMDISMNEPLDDIMVFADRNHLVRIFVNIIKNATQAIPQDRRGKIEINLYKEDDNAYITISDNGVGIPPEMRDKVFTPNFTTKSSGTGLGLAICVNMLETMQGSISFESNPDIGTTFKIEIPLIRNENEIGDVYLD